MQVEMLNKGYIEDEPTHVLTNTPHIHPYMHTFMHAHMHTCTHPYMHEHMHPCMHAYMHACIHTDSHHITSRRVALHHIALHCTTYIIALHYITLHYISLHNTTSQCIALLHYITSRYITLPYIHSYIHYITFHYITLHYICLVITIYVIQCKNINLYIYIYKYTVIYYHEDASSFILHWMTWNCPLSPGPAAHGWYACQAIVQRSCHTPVCDQKHCSSDHVHGVTETGAKNVSGSFEYTKRPATRVISHSVACLEFRTCRQTKERLSKKIHESCKWLLPYSSSRSISKTCQGDVKCSWEVYVFRAHILSWAPMWCKCCIRVAFLFPAPISVEA